MSEPTGERRGAQAYDELRGRLVSLGYLERPFERFVLGGLVHPGTFLVRHALVSLKVALATAPLLGLLFAVAVAWVNRPRFSRLSECLWLVLDFTLVFGGGIFLLEWLAGLILAAWVRWRGRGVAAYHATAARAGFAVSLLVSAYLAVWWRRRAGVTGGLLPDAIGLALLIVVNVVLARVSSLASLAALIRASDLPANGVRRSRSRHGLMTIGAAILLVLTFLVSPRSAPRHEAPVVSQEPVPGRLFVIAWDGIPLDLYRRANETASSLGREKGLLPWEDRALLFSLDPAPEGRGLSRPALWTEIATGRLAADHGVDELTDRRPVGLTSPLTRDVPLGVVLKTLLPGRRVAVSAGIRRSRTAWEILADQEGIGVVGWWATWPAIERHGHGERPFAVVSDRSVMSLRVPSPLDHGIVPAALAQELNRRFGQDLEAVRASLRGALGEGTEREAGDLHDSSPSARGVAMQAGLIDGWTSMVAGRLVADPRIADVFVYFPGLDILRASRLRASRDIGPGGSPSGEIESYARYVLENIHWLAGHLRHEDWLVIIGDPGRSGGLASGVESQAGVLPGTGEAREGDLAGAPEDDPARRKALILHHGESGAWIEISGPGVDPNARASNAWSPLDVTPTLLTLRGFPVSAEMPGTARIECLLPEWQQRLRVRTIPTYGENAIPALPTAESASEDEILERLRSLGYLN